MCLSIKVSEPSRVLSEGKHQGLEWIVTHNSFGFRCGYVRIPVGHSWHGMDWDKIRCDVHGGITFSEPDQPCDKGGADDAWWIGFDCAHAGDAPGPSLPGHQDRPWDYGVIRNQEYAEGQCRQLCEQAAKKQ